MLGIFKKVTSSAGGISFDRTSLLEFLSVENAPIHVSTIKQKKNDAKKLTVKNSSVTF